MQQQQREMFHVEVKSLIDDGILVPFDLEKHGPIGALIPIFTVKQELKDKVRPVLYHKRLNDYIVSAPGLDTAVCDEKLRQWRLKGSNVSILDLKRAYFQVFVDETLHRIQVVEHKGSKFVMTRLGSGLSIGPKVITSILDCVFAQCLAIRSADRSY